MTIQVVSDTQIYHHHQPSSPTISVQMAGDERVADELLVLYLTGKKRAGSGLVKQYESDYEALPKAADFWMILDKTQVPRCIIRTIRVEYKRFCEVHLENPVAEGEGDCSTETWRKLYQWFFAPIPIGSQYRRSRLRRGRD